MSDKGKEKDLSSKGNPIPFGSKEHEHLLRSAHKLTKKEATATIAQFVKDSKSMPYEMYVAAKQYMDALTSIPTVTSRVQKSQG